MALAAPGLAPPVIGCTLNLMQLEQFVSLLEAIAPLKLAEEWDNVGVLLAPGKPRSVRTVLLTIDLTERVMDEALEHGAQAIVAYHPPIWTGLKRLLPEHRTGRLLLRAVEHHLTIYSPHTALDAAAGGVNDWLSDAFDAAERRAILPTLDSTGVGQGRWLRLHTPLPLTSAVERIKRHLGLARVRLAEACSEVTTVALCAGAGGSVVQRATADLYLTGEMRHHDVLHAKETGTSVVLTDHTHCERGYLPSLQEKLASSSSGALRVVISQKDEDPLRIV